MSHSYVAKTEADVKREQIIAVLTGVSQELAKLSKIVVSNPSVVAQATENITELISTRMESYTASITDSITQFNAILGDMGGKIETLEEITNNESSGFKEVNSHLGELRKLIDSININVSQIDKNINGVSNNIIKNNEKVALVNGNVNLALAELKKITSSDIPKTPTKDKVNDRTSALIQEQHTNILSNTEEISKLKTLIENINVDIQYLKVNRNSLESGLNELKESQKTSFGALKAGGDKIVEIMRSDSQSLSDKISHVLKLNQEYMANTNNENLKDELIKVNSIYREAVEELDIYKMQIMEAKETIASQKAEIEKYKSMLETDLVKENKILNSQLDKLIKEHKALNDEFIALRIMHDALKLNNDKQEKEISELMEGH